MAMIRNGLFLLVMLGSMTIWLSQWPQASDKAPIIGVVSGEALLAALAAWRILVACARARDVTKHPIFRDLAAHGDARAIAAEIENALSSGEGRCFGNVAITDRFVVKLGFLHAVVRLDDVAWVYLQQTRHSVNFVPVGTTRSLEMFTFSQGHRFAPLSLDADDATLASLQAAAPRARFGFSAANEAWWKETRLSLRGKKTSERPAPRR